jgi:hypothetical protein
MVRWLGRIGLWSRQHQHSTRVIGPIMAQHLLPAHENKIKQRSLWSTNKPEQPIFAPGTWKEAIKRIIIDAANNRLTPSIQSSIIYTTLEAAR